MQWYALLILCVSAMSLSAAELSGRIELAGFSASPLENWQTGGTGILRSQGAGLQLQQAMLHWQQDVGSSWHLDVVANAYDDGLVRAGLTQAFAEYRPLMPSSVKFRSRIGFFYPRFSVENSAEGWLSPDVFTQSAINSWIGEELRVLGGEATLFSNGRARASKWRWETSVGVFRGNDTLGTLLAWRGFAMHDRQSLHNDRLRFAAIPSVVDRYGIYHPDWVEPFVEIDNRWGVYVGGHLSYLRKTELRYYYYDNQADSSQLNADRLYAWRTHFHSFALQHNFNASWRLLVQAMDGHTDMGPDIAAADFSSAFVALRWQKGKHRFYRRVEYFRVEEDDLKPSDQNSSHGVAYTLAYRYDMNEQLELGIEHHRNRNNAANRQQLGIKERQYQNQTRIVLSIRF